MRAARHSDIFRGFARTTIAFVLGLACCVFAVDRAIGWHTTATNGKGRVDSDVYRALARLELPGPRVRAVYLGDSVARQLFTPGAEPRADVRFLACNQGISMAGQCYLLEDALRRFPRLADVYLFYAPVSWRNNLGQLFTRDYFCGYFHRPAQVIEIFRLKRDFHLLAAQVGRMLLPNLLAANSDIRPAFEGTPTDFNAGLTARQDHSEPLLDALNWIWPPLPDAKVAANPNPDGRLTIAVSPVSYHFLDRMRASCRSRGVRLHVLPCPCPSGRNFDDPGLYDVPIRYLDAGKFRDNLHLAKPYIDEVRVQVIREFHLELESLLGASDQ